VRRISPLLWLALGGAALQLVSATLNFYTLGREPKSAWYGVPNAADLIVASAVVPSWPWR